MRGHICMYVYRIDRITTTRSIDQEIEPAATSRWSGQIGQFKLALIVLILFHLSSSTRVPAHLLFSHRARSDDRRPLPYGDKTLNSAATSPAICLFANNALISKRMEQKRGRHRVREIVCVQYCYCMQLIHRIRHNTVSQHFSHNKGVWCFAMMIHHTNRLPTKANINIIGYEIRV